MSGSRLEVEYERMTDRHELYAKYGIAAEVAQLFETELGTLLLGLRGLDEGWHLVPNGEAAGKLLNQIDRSTLGRLLHNLKGPCLHVFSSVADCAKLRAGAMFPLCSRECARHKSSNS